MRGRLRSDFSWRTSLIYFAARPSRVVPAVSLIQIGEAEQGAQARRRSRSVDPGRAPTQGRPRGTRMTAKVAANPNSTVVVGKAKTVKFGNDLPLALIAGPCALESRAHAFEMAVALKEITAKLGLGFVYKTSFDKANRTSAVSARG